MIKKMNKRKTLYAFLCIILLFFIGKTLSYFTENLMAKNEVEVGKFSTKIDEVFYSIDDWKPGQTVEKQVKIKNSGNVDALVRVRFKENWIRNKDILGTDGKVILPEGKKGFKLENAIYNDTALQDAAVKRFSKDLVIYNDNSDFVKADNKWLYYDGYYYYMGTIEPNKESKALLEALTMNPVLDNLVVGINYTNYLDSNGKAVYEKDFIKGKFGYDSARYVLSVEAETAAANETTINNVWKSNDLIKYIIGKYATIADVQ